jgi:hypothetical protein
VLEFTVLSPAGNEKEHRQDPKVTHSQDRITPNRRRLSGICDSA